MENPSVKLTATIDTSLTQGISTRFDSFNNIINKVSTAAERGTEDGLEALGEKIADMQREFLAIGSHYITGELYNSISSEGGGLSYTIGSTLGDEEFSPKVIEYGRGSVVPIRCDFLHYFNQRTDEEIFSRFSKPYAGDPYVRPSAIYGGEIAHETIMESINGWLE